MTSLKVAPCLFGVLYLADAVSRRRMPWAEVVVSATSALVLVFVPFLFFGGVGEIPQWLANAEFYSSDNPLWGFAALANHIVDSKVLALPCIGRFALATRILAAALAGAALLEAAAWFLILTPMQIPNPCFSGSLNGMLQNEALLLLLAVSGARTGCASPRM